MRVSRGARGGVAETPVRVSQGTRRGVAGLLAPRRLRDSRATAACTAASSSLSVASSSSVELSPDRHDDLRQQRLPLTRPAAVHHSGSYSLSEPGQKALVFVS